MGKIRVGVLRGGPSPEYDVSLQSGGAVLDALSDRPEKYEVSDILISKDGAWNVGGLLSSPVRAMRRSDIFFNALHGFYGEDGKIQSMLDGHQFPYTGSRTLASAFSMNKLLAKKRFREVGLHTPRCVFFESEAPKGVSNVLAAKKRALLVGQTLSSPWVVKPVAGGSSIGVVFFDNIDALVEGLLDPLTKGAAVFVEEAIVGREATCGVVEDFHYQPHCALPPLEITSSRADGFFDFDAKYDGTSKEVPYGSFSESESLLLQRVAREAHKALGLRQYSRTDMILDDEGNAYVLETNALPGLTKNSLLPKSVEASGSSFEDFIEHTVSRAFL